MYSQFVLGLSCYQLSTVGTNLIILSSSASSTICPGCIVNDNWHLNHLFEEIQFQTVDPTLLFLDLIGSYNHMVLFFVRFERPKHCSEIFEVVFEIIQNNLPIVLERDSWSRDQGKIPCNLEDQLLELRPRGTPNSLKVPMGVENCRFEGGY